MIEKNVPLQDLFLQAWERIPEQVVLTWT